MYGSDSLTFYQNLNAISKIFRLKIRIDFQMEIQNLKLQMCSLKQKHYI